MRIVIVDPEALFRAGVRTVLEATSEHRLVGEAGAPAAGLALVDERQPDLVVLDLALPDCDGVALIGEIRRRASGAAVLALSASDQIQDVLDALDAGAIGYLLKSDGPEELTRALRMAARAERYIAPALAGRVSMYDSRRRAGAGVLSLLSVRERQIFHLSGACLLTREIAQELGVSPKTVDTHLLRIHRKLGLRNSAELVRLAVILATAGERRAPLAHAPDARHAGGRAAAGAVAELEALAHPRERTGKSASVEVLAQPTRSSP
jgi:DNA-binding NarL/FixJ family response regulator